VTSFLRSTFGDVSFVPGGSVSNGVPCFSRVVWVDGDVAVGREDEKMGLSVRRLWISGFLIRGCSGSASGSRACAAAAALGVVMTAEVVGGRSASAERMVWRDLRWCAWPSVFRLSSISAYSCCRFTKTCAPDGRSGAGIPPSGSRKIRRSREMGWDTGGSDVGEYVEKSLVSVCTMLFASM